MVIAPAGVYRTWIDVLKGDLSDDLRERIIVHLWQSGSGKGLERDRKAFLATEEPRALLMNIEALSRPGEAREFCRKFLDQRTMWSALTRAPRSRTKASALISSSRSLSRWQIIDACFRLANATCAIGSVLPV
jgi:hypothetical protein